MNYAGLDCPQPPEGFIPFFLLFAVLYEEAEAWGAMLPLTWEQAQAPDENGRPVTVDGMVERFEPFIAERLATGTLRAAGIAGDGSLYWAPVATWRRSFQQTSPLENISAVRSALLNKQIPFPAGERRFQVCHPILAVRDLAVAFGAANPPPAPPPVYIQSLTIEDFFKASAANMQVPASDMSILQPKPVKGRGNA